MSTIPGVSGQGSKPKVRLVRFPQHIAIGTGLDMQSFLEDGMRILNVPIRLSWYSDSFLGVHFEHTDKKQRYVQLIPWAACATVLIGE